MDEGTPIGERIRYWRKQRDRTQETLAELVGRSVAWLSEVERGERAMDSIKVLFMLADVLKVGPWDLLPKFGLPPNGGASLDPPKGIHAVSRAVMASRPPDREPPLANRLRVDVEQAKQLRYAGRHEAVAIVLPELILSSRAATAAEVPGGWWCLTGAYQVASSFARTLGELELAWVAADRAVTAARNCGDEWMVAASQRLLASALLRRGTGWLDDAGAVCADAADALAPTDATPLAGWSLWGSLQLTLADITSRAMDMPGARRLLGDARVAAERVGPGRNDYWEGFGPANVGVNEIIVALDWGDPVEALAIGETVEVDQLPSAESRARFCLQLARAYSLRRNDKAMVLVLKDAVRYAPETVRYSVLARELVLVALRREQRSRTPGLRQLAARLGVAD